MPRIRSIKPEFWDSPSTARADLAVRLVYIAMWNWADDSGHGTANLKELEAFCFPNDDVAELPRKSRGNSGDSRGTWRNFAEICGEVAEAYGIKFYKVHERPYYVIPNFKAHQSKDFRPKSKYPTEEEGYFYDVTSGNAIDDETGASSNTGTSGDSSGNSATSSGKSSLVIGEQGNRVTGENTCSSNDERDPKPDAYPQSFEDWWQLYPNKAGKRKAYPEWQRALKRITPEELNRHTQILADFHKQEGTPKKFIPHPKTWLGRDGWDDELTPRNQQSAPGRMSNAETFRQLREYNAQTTQPTPQPAIEDWFTQQAIGN